MRIDNHRFPFSGECADEHDDGEFFGSLEDFANYCSRVVCLGKLEDVPRR